MLARKDFMSIGATEKSLHYTETSTNAEPHRNISAEGYTQDIAHVIVTTTSYNNIPKHLVMRNS